jgi:hypothetical protein
MARRLNAHSSTLLKVSLSDVLGALWKQSLPHAQRHFEKLSIPPPISGRNRVDLR